MIWRIAAGSDRRFRAGHPWIYSNELQQSPKGIEPGQEIELHDAGGKFLARGYGNPASLIAFRAVSRDPNETEPLSKDALTRRLQEARALRHTAGLQDCSYRLCFGEADFLPGLIIDRYALRSPRGSEQVFSVQAHTAGMNRALPRIYEALQALSGDQWPMTAIVLRNDIAMRKLEGLDAPAPEIIREIPGQRLNEAKILIRGIARPLLEMQTDLHEGQKTGFFLDQSANIQLAAHKLSGLRPAGTGKLRILDLCCYVGQWGAQLASSFTSSGVDCEVLAVDASARALDFAKRNIEAAGARCEILKADVLQGLGGLEDRSFDLVVSDPPALIKSRKDIPAGTHAYLQLNTQVFRLIRPGGGVVSCSCSSLLEEESFIKVLSKAAYRNRRTVRWMSRGCQGPDHPMLSEFPEGRYLKGWIGRVDT